MVCDLVGSNYAVRVTSKKNRVKKQKPRNPWFHLWGKEKSHALIIQILEVLGYQDNPDGTGDACSSDTVLRRIFDGIPDGPCCNQTVAELNRIQALALLSKNDDVNFGIDKEQVAWAKFQESELSCRMVNKLLAGGVDADTSAILFYAQGFIADVLGPLPSLDSLDYSFGPGATVGCTSNKTTPLWKLSPDVTLTHSMRPLVEELRLCMPGWLARPDTRFSFVKGRLEFVAKSWKTKRSIMITGGLNAITQLAHGRYMKRRLMLAGINLSNGQTRHRALAREASIDDSWSTVDLSAASDSIAYQLVMDLLPWEWFTRLEMMRDSEVTYNGETLQLQKFSAMGCGFTFELETLIFWSLIYGICRLYRLPFEASVYGDDIIVRPSVATLLQKHFPILGFNLNTDKTFISGEFKESCGGDFCNGLDVRPFFLKSLRFNGRFTYHTVCSFYNFLQRKPWFDTDGKIRALLLAQIPEDLRLYGPPGYGDGHLIDTNWLFLNHPFKIKDGGEPYVTFKSYSAVPYKDKEGLSLDDSRFLSCGAYAVTLASRFPYWVPFNLFDGDHPLRQARLKQVFCFDDASETDWHVTRLPGTKRMRAKTTRIRVYQQELTSRFGLM